MRLRTRTLAVLALLALAPALGCGAAPAPRHLVLISVDTLRADHLGSYGGEVGLTPHLDGLARESARFERAYAPVPLTVPSLAALMTGRHPAELGVESNVSAAPERIPTLAERLRARGFRTGAAVGNGVVTPRTGLHRGFERYETELPRQVQGTHNAPVTDAALRILAQLRSKGDASVFLWVHYLDPHGPYTPPERLRALHLRRELSHRDGRRRLPLSQNERGVGGIPLYQYRSPRREVGYYRAGYKAEVGLVDREVGRLLAELERQGMLAESVVVLTADHGESLGEGDYWFAHGERLNEASVRVPLLVRIPGRAASVRSEVASLLDLVATLAPLFDLDVEEEGPGVDLFASGAAREPRPLHLMSFWAPPESARLGVVRGEFKLVRSLEGKPAERLYRLPDEQHDLRSELPEVARELGSELDAFFATRRGSQPAAPPSASERELLRRLGYAED